MLSCSHNVAFIVTLQYLRDCCAGLVSQQRQGWKKWLTEGTVDGVELSSKKITSDAFALKLWRCWVDIDAPPNELMHRLLQ